MLVIMQETDGRGKKSDISLLLVANRRHSVGRNGRVGGEEGLTARQFFFRGFVQRLS